MVDPSRYHGNDGKIDWGLFVAAKGTGFCIATALIMLLGPLGALLLLAAGIAAICRSKS